MAASAAQLEFAAEIVTFLVALTGIALVALRAQLYSASRWMALALGLGFTALAGAAFVHGAAMPMAPSAPGVVALRLMASVVFALAGSLGLVRQRRFDRLAGPDRQSGPPGLSPGLLLPGAVLIGVAAVLSYWTTRDIQEMALLVGALLVGAALALASRRSIGARLTATAAATLILIVVVLSVALSTILSSTVRDDAMRRLQSRANRVAATASVSWKANLADAKLVASSVEGLGLAQPVDTGKPGSRARLQQGIDELSTEFFANVGLEWVTPTGGPGGVFSKFPTSIGSRVASALAGSNLVSRAISTGQPAGTAGVAAGQALAVAAYPDTSASTGAVLGVAVVVSPLNDLIAAEVQDDSTLSAVLVGAGGVVLDAYPASARHQVRSELGLALSELRGRPPTGIEVSGQFAAAAPVEGGTGHPVLVALVETPTAEVDATRQSLFRTLFLIALGGSLIAFLLSVLVGDRLNRGLEQLTGAARRISSGETLVRTGIESPDEIGTLAEAFDSMAESIEDKTAALRAAALEEAELRSRLQSVVSGMGEALIALDGAGHVTELNTAAERLLGLQRDPTLGRLAASFLEVRLDDGSDLVDKVVRETGRPLTLEGTLGTRRGQVPVAVSVGVLAVDGTASPGVVMLLRDLRPERELERMKTEFLSRVGHELRTPLTAILGFGQLLASRPIPPEQAQMLHAEILEQSHRLLRTVEMLEFFASAGANRLGLDLVRVKAKEITDAASSRWTDKIGPAHVLSCRVQRGLPELNVDARWLGLAIDELIDNAMKFSPGGGPVSVMVERGENGGVAIAITDRGEGMSPQELRAAFDEFVQGDSSDTRRFGGLGLGLPLAKRVAEAHGGRLDGSSSIGEGSRFVLLLPAAERPVSRRSLIGRSRT